MLTPCPVPYQASTRTIYTAANFMGLGQDKVMLNIQRYGNTITQPFGTLSVEYRKELNKGVLIVFAFGGGFTKGATLVK